MREIMPCDLIARVASRPNRIGHHSHTGVIFECLGNMNILTKIFDY